MSFDLERLYKLVPSYQRIHDEAAGNALVPGENHDGPLRSLLQLVAEQIAVLEENFEQLYDDQFIETCAEWVVPYIGELVGTRGLTLFPNAAFSERGEVANTISYRRRKGTASIIEQLARDVTGWNASVVEYFQLLATTQYMNHLRPGNLAITGLRDWELLEYVNTPFDKLAKTADVRSIQRTRGKYNIPNIGIYLWRFNSYSSRHSPAFKVDALRYKFDALAKDIQLYNQPVAETSISHLSEPVNVPMALSRFVTNKYLNDYYGIGKSILIYNNSEPVIGSNGDAASKICVCNLSDIKDGSGTVTGWANMPQNKIAIDPILGRLAFPSSEPSPLDVYVDYHYAFSANMGGGDYGRTANFSTDLESQGFIKVSKNSGTIQSAIDALEATGGVVEVMDNEYYIEKLHINIAAGKKIEIRAADNIRPILVLDGDFDIAGDANSELHINGFLIVGSRLRLPVNDSLGKTNLLRTLYIRDCTLLPGMTPATNAAPQQPAMPRLFVAMPDVTVIIDQSITGALRISDESDIRITNCIVDSTDQQKVAFAGLNDLLPGGKISMATSTIIGKVRTVEMILATNTIFLAHNQLSGEDPPIMAERLQEGCVRFSYIPQGARLPRKYHCQPEIGEDNVASIKPVFTSLTYGSPGYCQLSRLCSVKVSEGGDNGSEMGAFNQLYQPQREQNLRTRLNEYLRFGLEAGIYYAS